MISYAQNFEDVLLARVFCGKSSGFYVDVGAHDPEYLSVTKHFYDQGWRGINIEPIPAACEKLAKYRPRDVNLAVAAGRSNTSSDIFVPDDSAYATLDPEVAIEASGKTHEQLTVPVRTLDSILESNHVPEIAFLNIDVEGTERAVIEGIDLRRFRPVVILVEATKPSAPWDYDAPSTLLTHEEWEPLLLGQGYLFAYFDGLNRFYVREEDQHLKRYFAIPVGPVRDAFRLRAETVAEENLCEEIRQLNHVVERLGYETRQLREESERKVHVLTLALAARDMLIAKDRRSRLVQIVQRRLTRPYVDWHDGPEKTRHDNKRELL